jgi:hypothetical protein
MLINIPDTYCLFKCIDCINICGINKIINNTKIVSTFVYSNISVSEYNLIIQKLNVDNVNKNMYKMTLFNNILLNMKIAILYNGSSIVVK